MRLHQPIRRARIAMIAGAIVTVSASAFGQIEQRLFDKQHAVPAGKAAHELLRPLPDKSPAQMAEDDNPALIIGLAVANDAASAF